jgi:2-octaprenyl-6-methoxyphenol hydroxylase
MQALSNAVHTDPSITLLAPECASAFNIDEPVVRVTLNSGEITTSLLVAADGKTSALRDAAGIKVVGWDYGQIGIVTTVAFERPHEGRAVQHFLPSGPFAILPLRNNRACITWSETAEEAHRILALNDTAFLAEVDRRFGGKLGPITLDGPRQSWPLTMHLARSYIAPRFALVGDAAHGVHPIAGQGLNLALRDTAALAECIAEAVHLGLDPGSAFALEKYERWRRFDNMTSATAYDALNRLFSNDWTLLRAARDTGLSLVDRFPELKSFFISEGAGTSGTVPKLLRGEEIRA